MSHTNARMREKRRPYQPLRLADPKRLNKLLSDALATQAGEAALVQGIPQIAVSIVAQLEPTQGTWARPPTRAYLQDHDGKHQLGEKCYGALSGDNHIPALEKMEAAEKIAEAIGEYQRSIGFEFHHHAHHFEIGVGLRFQGIPPQPLGARLYQLPAEQALLVMAGAHNRPELFKKILDASADDDMVKKASARLCHGAFISDACLQKVVHAAADQGLVAQNLDEHEGTRSELEEKKAAKDRDATHHLFRAHRVVSAYLMGLQTDYMKSNPPDVLNSVFQTVRLLVQQEPETDDRDMSAFSGIATGLCLAGVMRFFKDELECHTMEQDRLKFGLSVLSSGLSFIPVAGPGISAVLSLISDPIAKRVFETKDSTEQVFRLGASLEDAALRGDTDVFHAREFNMQLEKTMRYCGFSY